jgi:hypothetical protein
MKENPALHGVYCIQQEGVACLALSLSPIRVICNKFVPQSKRLFLFDLFNTKM